MSTKPMLLRLMRRVRGGIAFFRAGTRDLTLVQQHAGQLERTEAPGRADASERAASPEESALPERAASPEESALPERAASPERFVLHRFRHRSPRSTHRSPRRFRKLRAAVALLAIAAGIGAFWLWGTPSGTRLRYLAADTLITTQHREWAKYVIGEAALKQRIEEYERQFDEMGRETLKPVQLAGISAGGVAAGAATGANAMADGSHAVRTGPRSDAAVDAGDDEPLYEVEDISGEGWSGKLLIVSDPTRIRIGVPGVPGHGEKVSSMMLRYGAEAGVNGGGFSDPNWSGNGFKPMGIVISGGQVFYDDTDPKDEIDIVGFTGDGALIAGKYTLERLQKMGVREAVSFRPRLIVNGKGLVKNADDGWGFAPRTAVAQTKDGTVLFAVIDGRQPHSVGATLYDVQQLFLERGAVVAANLDGGASTVLVTRQDDGAMEIRNKPATSEGERYLPTAFLVFRHPETARIGNVWEGIDMERFDPAKW